MKIPQFWIRYGNKIAIGIALGITVFVYYISTLVGTSIVNYSQNALKSIDSLNYELSQNKKWSNITVSANKPTEGIITLFGTVEDEETLQELKSLLQKENFDIGIKALHFNIKIRNQQ